MEEKLWGSFGSCEVIHFDRTVHIVTVELGTRIFDAVDDLVEALVDFDSVAEEDNGEMQKIVRKHVIVKADDNSVLTGHSDAIIRLIEKGPFSSEELDAIQSALDDKR